MVPNIYGIDDIIETKKVISDIVNELNSSKLNDLIKGLEVITLSESDASFLGYYNTTGGNSTIPNAFYLTIDCGKGTTDYSILKTGQRNVREIIPVYRNGFAGAGNLITSAFFHSIFSFIIENADNKAAALKELTQTFDASNIGSITFKLFNIVERLKINYSNQKSGIKKEEIEAEWNRIKNRDFTLKNYFDKGAKTIDTLFDILNDCANCYDWNGYINHAVDIICNNIVMNLKEVVKNLDPAVKCGGVLLTGRAFLFKPLLTKLKSQLESIPQLRAVEIKSPTDSVTLKNVCMLGLFRDNFVVDTDLPGWPIPVFVVDETKTTKSNNGSTWDFWTKVVDAFNKAEMTSAMEENSYELNIANFNDVKFMMGGEFYEASATGFYQIAESEGKPDFIFAKDGFVLRRFDSDRRFIRSSNLITTASTDLRDIVNKSVKPSLFPAQIETEFMKAYAVLAPAVASVVEKPPYDPLAGLRPHKKYETPN